MIGSRLAQLRKAHKMTQQQLADKLFVRVTTVSAYETNNAFPPPQSLITISKLFGCTIDYLLGNEITEIMPNERVYLHEIAPLSDSQRHMLIELAKTYTKEIKLQPITSPVRHELEPIVSLLETFDKNEIRAIQAFIKSTIALRQ